MVFISYSHDSDELCDKVLELSNWLRSQGVDANIDQYEGSPAEGWPRWTEAQIRDAQFVLVVCTNMYQKKATLQVADDVGLGTKWETNIIENILYESGSITNKFIPVVFNNDDVRYILTPLKGQTYYNLDYKQKKEDLKNRLLGIKKNKKPPLGSYQPLEFKTAKPDARLLITGVIDTSIWDKAKWKGVGYATDFKSIPMLGIYYENADYGLKIFQDWINRFGHEDKNEEIYISIIEDDDSDSYSIHIGADIDGVFKRFEKQGIENNYNLFMQFDRWHRMQIVDKKSLNIFKEEYSKFKTFNFLPMKIEHNQMIPVTSLSIKKEKIRFRKFSELTDKNDYDYLALELREEQDKI